MKKSTQNSNLVLGEMENVHINSSLPMKARVADYIRQVGNPYHYNYNGTTVTISFAGKTKIEECLAVLVNSQLPLLSKSPVITTTIMNKQTKGEELLPAA